ncbi:MAG TPA: zf-HC2 domain-containing protein [Longimicrobiales bacterium]
MDRVSVSCQEFLARHSDFLDGELDVQESARLEAHLASCPTCARYDRVVRSGVRLLRGLPEVEPSSDFFPRLQHRIYNLEEELRAGKRAPGVGAVASLAVAGTIALLAWSPLLRFGQDGIGIDRGAERVAAEAPSGPGASARRPAPTHPAPAAATGPTVQLAAEAEDLPRIDPRSVPWGVGSVFDDRTAAGGAWESWWRIGVTAPAGAPAVRRSLRVVDFRAPGPYSPLIIEVPTFRRASAAVRPGNARLARD